MGGLVVGLQPPAIAPKSHVSRPCIQCGKSFSRRLRTGPGNVGKFCSPECGHAAKTGKPAPGFVTPESERVERIRANGLINKRLKLGWFEKPARCMKCNRKARLDSHHTDYAKPDHVYWVCRSCHMREHHHPGTLAGIPAFVCDRQPVAGGAR